MTPYDTPILPFNLLWNPVFRRCRSSWMEFLSPLAFYFLPNKKHYGMSRFLSRCILGGGFFFIFLFLFFLFFLLLLLVSPCPFLMSFPLFESLYRAWRFGYAMAVRLA